MSRYGAAEHGLSARRTMLARLRRLSPDFRFQQALTRGEAPGGRSTDRQILDQIVDAEIVETTARRLDKRTLGPRAAFVLALDGG